MQRIKVWPLRAGLAGFDALGNAITLQPGEARWMDAEAAELAAARGDVQILAGLDSSSLVPVDRAIEAEASERAPRSGKRYRRSDIRAEDRD